MILKSRPDQRVQPDFESPSVGLANKSRFKNEIGEGWSEQTGELGRTGINFFPTVNQFVIVIVFAPNLL